MKVTKTKGGRSRQAREIKEIRKQMRDLKRLDGSHGRTKIGPSRTQRPSARWTEVTDSSRSKTRRRKKGTSDWGTVPEKHVQLYTIHTWTSKKWRTGMLAEGTVIRSSTRTHTDL